MIYYTKNGSIPYPYTDGTEGWVVAPSPPECPEGKEVVWCGYEWIVRDPKPQDRPGYQWNWQHDQHQWVEGAWGIQPLTVEDVVEITTVADLTTSQAINLTTSQLG